MITKQASLAVLCLVMGTSALFAQRQMESLGRGVTAVRTGTSSVYVGWRLLGTDPEEARFNLYRVTAGVTNLLAAGVTNSCNYADAGALQALAHAWFVQPVLNGVTQANSAAFTMPAGTPVQPYRSIPLQKPADGVTASGPFTYMANDCSAADLDGDGEYEIVLKWDPSNAKDNSQSGFTGDVLLDGYKLDGTRLWRINLGPNIRAGAHYTQFMVYDLDGDGRAEVACKTAPGTQDGLGHYVDGNAAYTVYTNSSGYILSGPEYFTIFDGLTGARLATTNYVPGRGNVADWGDSYGNRVDRFLAGVAYLDGIRPSVVMCRGYYTRAALCAWDWRNGQLTQRWLFDTGNATTGPLAGYRGQGAHSLTVGDVDGDGKDEITYGACAIDHDGTGLYTTRLGHGDALHMSDMDPDRPGLEVWMVHESPSSYGLAGLEFRDARTGGLIFGVDGQNVDIGRGVAIDIDPNYRGYEMWGSRGGLMNASGVQLPFSRPGAMNFAIYWDADLNREILDGTTISKYNPANGSVSAVLSPGGISSNNGTKATPALSADLFGDWREEVLWRTSDNLELRLYTPTALATNRLVTLMHDPQYRLAIAWQNVAYNQPPHPGYYLGPGMFPPPVPPVSDAALVWRGGGANLWDVTTANWRTNAVWIGANPATTFANGRSVLFDLSGSNHAAVSLSVPLQPAQVTVHSPKDYIFGGTGRLEGGMTLLKAGPGRLTLNNTNAYTGGTMVRGGALFVNGLLHGSPVTVERRGSPEGPSHFGGQATLGAGLTLQAGCLLTVGPNTNSAGTLTVTNTVSLQGATCQFDLSGSPSGPGNDRVRVIGNLKLSGTNVIELTQLAGSLGAGVYPLIEYSGTLTGGLANLALRGAFLQEVILTNPPGQIAVLALLPAAPPNAPGDLTATAAGAFQVNLAWSDNSTNENGFVIERATGSPSGFATIATVPPDGEAFQDVAVSPSTTYYYRVSSTNLAGLSLPSNTNSATTTPLPTALTWRGDGGANVWNIGGSANWYDGANLVVYNEGAHVFFDQTGSNNVPVALDGPLAPGGVTFSAGKNYTLGTTSGGTLAGPMALTMAGPGTLTINTTNTFNGGVNLNAGVLALGSTTAAGSGPFRFNGGTLRMIVGSQQTYANALVVNSNSTLQSQGGNNNIVSGPWSGSSNATLGVAISSGTFTLAGNMTAFPGTVSLGNSAGVFRFYGSSGSANTTFDLGAGTATLNNRNGITVTLGALAGGPGTFLSGAGAVDAPSTYIIGAKNLSTTFSGKVQNATSARIVNLQKVGVGILTLTGTNTYSGTTLVSGGEFRVNGSHASVTNVVTVQSGGTLGGAGILGGPVVVQGALAPGSGGIGRLTFNSSLTLGTGAVARFELTKIPLSNDVLDVSGDCLLSGTLNVIHLDPQELLEAGDRFPLLSAPRLSGQFTGYLLPALSDGLAWNVSRLVVDGSLWVVRTDPPAFSGVTREAGQLRLAGQGGTPGWDYHVLSSTNLALPPALWTPVLTNQFDGSGQFNVAVPVEAGLQQRFYRLSVP